MAMRESNEVNEPRAVATRAPARRVLGMRVDATSYAHAAETVLRWARRGESRYVCVATVHMVMEAHDHADFQQVVNAADLVTPDGMPLVWALKLLGVRDATRVYGPDLTPIICERAAAEGVPVGFYGGSQHAVDLMVANLTRQFPTLQVAYQQSPPFRPLDQAEHDRELREIRESGARILFVGLGCPKQGRWMAAHRDQLDCVMLGVGAAFDFLSGQKAMAPDWIQSLGLEWLFRLACEPRRLWRRYLYNNPRYIALLALQLAHREPSLRGRPR